eukprot:scaffold4267_cov61-Phaeocystis_antarctica.AAC.2
MSTRKVDTPHTRVTRRAPAPPTVTATHLEEAEYTLDPGSTVQAHERGTAPSHVPTVPPPCLVGRRLLLRLGEADGVP